MIKYIADEIISGRRLKSGDDVSFLVKGDLEELKREANRIREVLCGKHVDLCTIVNGLAGKCSENCKFCAQSAHHHTGAKTYPFLDIDSLVKECKRNEDNGAHKFSIVTAGRSLSKIDFELAIKAYKKMHEECHNISLCASHGFLTEEQFRILKENGVTMYHENIETSERYFPQICTTHTYAQKIECIKAAQRAGLFVCSGGIIGMGETWQDRIDMAFALAELKIDSIPINALMPIKGTPLENQKVLSEEDILRSIALFRFINPTADVRLAAGRSLMKECGKEAFFSGANATLTGDMLTTSGNNTTQDKKMLLENGFDIEIQ